MGVERRVKILIMWFEPANRNGTRLWHGLAVSTITEIEAAIERLPAQQVAQLAAWLEEFRGRLQSPGEHLIWMHSSGHGERTWTRQVGNDRAPRYERI